MMIAVTGANGRVGKRVVALALKKGHQVHGIDLAPTPDLAPDSHEFQSTFTYRQVDLTDYNDTLNALTGVNAVIHLAGHPNPTDYVVMTHNNNVVASYNVLRAAAEHNINRVAQASSVNVITMVYSQHPHFNYFPIDENHPCLPDEPYGLSKLICEAQADSIVRRYPSMRIASIRLHWSVPDCSQPQALDPQKAKNDLWGYVHEDSGAEAFLLAVTKENGKWSGHEPFFIVAPKLAHDLDSAHLKEKYWPDVPLRDGMDLSGQDGFFDCSKAERLLEWKHTDPTRQ
ncbi:NAD(P)-binding protein [Marasmius fiardii PR-910]|nr:NAD(P)-binding protein [Marasmius fiardii PR-910]